MSDAPGRTCPIRYRYGAPAIAAAPLRYAETLYVVGGLYGNAYALDKIEAMAAAETGPVTICFNGDFNWFNVDAQSFVDINRRVLQHDAILGNVEAELGQPLSDEGCGCAYPDAVSGDIVERSNRIHARLKARAQQHPEIIAALAQLPMLARYQVGECRVGVVHGDADSLAGWRFDPLQLAQPDNEAWLAACFAQAEVDVFASSHTCSAGLHARPAGIVINNGAAGMSNASAPGAGLISRIATTPSPHPALSTARSGEVFVDALAVPYDTAAWREAFLRNWPAGSDAFLSYYSRIALPLSR